MSAICGIFDRTGRPVERRDAERLLASLGSYGPDGSGLWLDSSIALGHQHFADTPEAFGERQPSGGRPPLDDGELMITADARLDNRDELCERLSIAAADRPMLSDSQIILASYARWGAESPRELLGDFAFVIWDPRMRRLFGARDPMGVKPFYYRETGAEFSFATALHALVATGHNEVNWSTVKNTLLRVVSYHPSATFFEDVSKLPAGHALEADESGVRVARYFVPENSPSIRYADDRDYPERLRELLHLAVHSRLRSSGSVAAHLSGGLDSAAIAAIAARAERARGRTPRLYSYSPSPPPDHAAAPEWAFMAAICEQEGLACEYTQVSTDEAHRYLERDVAYAPPLASTAGNLQIFRRASAAGARVLLSGWGGDELVSFHGLGYYAERLAEGRVVQLWRDADDRLRNGTVRPRGLAKARFLLMRAALPWLPAGFARVFGGDFIEVPCYAPFITPEIVARLRTVAAGPMPLMRWEEPGVRRHQLAMLSFGHLQRRMETWTAETAGLGLTVRYPLLDRRLVEFALGVPSRLYIERGSIRSLFRTAISPLVPAAVAAQKKQVEVSLEPWQRVLFAAVRRRIDDCVKDASLPPGDGIIDRAALSRTSFDMTTPAARQLGRRVLSALQCEAILRLT